MGMFLPWAWLPAAGMSGWPCSVREDGRVFRAIGGAIRLNRGLANTQAMRNGQNKRMRGRNRKSHNPLTRVYESNGPDVKIRGTASHIAEKYIQLARDAQSSGDPVSAENYHQHAEHYFRLIAAAQEHLRQTQPSFYPQQQPGQPGENRGNSNDDSFDDDGDGDDQPSMAGEPYAPQQTFYPQQQPQPQPQHQQPQQNYQPRPQQNFQPSHEQDVERLPSFITGGQGSQQPSPQQNSPQQYSPQNGQGPNGQNGQNGNGYEGQADRFPLHRRRRRHRGPRDHNTPGEGSTQSDQGPIEE
jgi:hypothetical protein